MSRYEVQPIADAECNALSGRVILETDDLAAAKQAAAAADEAFGAGILDTTSGLIDVGVGFGVEMPALED